MNNSKKHLQSILKDSVLRMKALLTGKSSVLKTKNFFKRERSNSKYSRWLDSRLLEPNLLFLLQLRDLHTLKRALRKAKEDLVGREIDPRLVRDLKTIKM